MRSSTKPSACLRHWVDRSAAVSSGCGAERHPRVELARSTGLSFAAVSAITSKLIADEVLCEAETETVSWPDDSDDEDADGLTGRRRGRPAVLLTLNPEFGRIVAVSLRMNMIETLIADFSGSALAQSRLELPTRALDASALRHLVVAQIDAMLEATATPRHRLLGIGIALQGIAPRRPALGPALGD